MSSFSTSSSSSTSSSLSASSASAASAASSASVASSGKRLVHPCTVVNPSSLKRTKVSKEKVCTFSEEACTFSEEACPVSEERCLYTQLDELLQSYVSMGSKYVYSDFSDVEGMWKTYLDTGFLVVTNAVSMDSIKRRKLQIIDGLKTMLFGHECDLSTHTAYQLSLSKYKDTFDDALDAKIFAFDAFRNSQYGHGNASFAYLFSQLLGPTDLHSTLINDEDVCFNVCPGNDINLSLLVDNPDVAKFLLSEPCGAPRVFSIDSCKVASFRRPLPSVSTPLASKGVSKMTKQELTKWHQDIYGDELERTQSMIVCEGLNALGFLPYGHKEDVKVLLSKILGNPKLYNRTGFVSLYKDERLVSILDKYWVSAPRGSLVVWASGVPHASGVRNDAADPNGLFGLNVGADKKPIGNQPTYRFICGTQRHVDLRQESINKLAVLSLFGFVPEYYSFFNKGTAVRRNMVCTKTTQWKVPRSLKPGECEQWDAALQFYSDVLDGTCTLSARQLSLVTLMGYK